ncbi:GDSL-type esterase/lipase family protein [Actinobaculum sp. 352]|uniref:GDSL-type esterase/lipase family protein n=1 Tax=Actinobaculum sp. 352 TaxID=2490946 RepID=UPI001F495F4A|nr:GDSL-type esterase/lipase family protein [Actinobaculum sp. 352]
MTNPIRVLFIGDELVAGLGDARALGWTGRVMARTANDPPILAMTLAVPGEDSAHLATRWEEEVGRRIDPETQCRLVVGLGSHDLDTGQTLARARLHLANLLDSAERMHLKPFVVGPPPRRDFPEKIQADLTRAYRDVCERRNTVFVETFSPLVTHENWNTDLTLSGGYHPGQAGYGLIAWLVLHNGWNQWLGVKAAPAS